MPSPQIPPRFVQPIIDRQRAVQHFGDEEVMERLLQRFPATLASTSEMLQQAMDQGNTEDFRVALYQIEGAASWVCADPLLSAASALQACLDENHPLDGDSIRQGMAALRHEIERASRCVEGTSQDFGDSTRATGAAGTSAAGAGSPAGTAGPQSAAAPPERETQAEGGVEGEGSVFANLPATLEQIGNDSGLFRSMATRFPDHLSKAMQRMQVAFNRRDWACLCREAHSLKCGSSMMGATSLSGAAALLEKRARALVDGGGADAADDAVSDVNANMKVLGIEAQRVCNEIQTLNSCLDSLVQQGVAAGQQGGAASHDVLDLVLS